MRRYAFVRGHLRLGRRTRGPGDLNVAQRLEPIVTIVVVEPRRDLSDDAVAGSGAEVVDDLLDDAKVARLLDGDLRLVALNRFADLGMRGRCGTDDDRQDRDQADDDRAGLTHRS